MIDQSTDLQAARADLERDRTALNQRELEIETEAISRLEKAHAALILECRAVEDRFTAAAGKCDDAQQDWQESENVARMIELGIADRMSDKPRSFALPPEISEWESKLANLRLRHANAMTVTAAKWATLEGLRGERLQLRAAFENLKTQEHERRQEIAYCRAELSKRQPRKPLGKFEVVDGARLVSA